MPWPSPELEADLLRRLAAGDRDVSADLAAACFEPLLEMLLRTNPTVDEHLVAQAAGEAILNLGDRPDTYKPEAGKSLKGYLMMSASFDLRNLRRKERRHQFGRKSFDLVELGADGGNGLAVGDEPSVALELQEELRRAEESILSVVKDGLTPQELAGLELVLDGERKTDRFADVLGLMHLPKEQREAEVKRFKDRMQARIKRARGPHDETS